MALGIGEIAAPIVGAALGMINRKEDDRRQIEQQKKLTKIQSEANEQAANTTFGLQKRMWEETNYEAQLEHMKNAGLNPALAYGMKGGGGVTTGSAAEAGVQGGTASGAAQTEQNKIAMGMQLAQTALLAAQTEKTKAEAKNLGAGTEKIGVETKSGTIDLENKQITQQETIEKIIAESSKALSDAAIAMRENQIGDETGRDKIRSIQEDAINKILTNKEKTTEIRIKEAEAAIQEFEANATKNGVSTKAPWYIKLMSKLYDEIENKIK